MKALVIAALLFFGLRAMSAETELAENKKSDCPYSVHTFKREPKVIPQAEVESENAQQVVTTVLH
jgi:hypothetical protein